MKRISFLRSQTRSVVKNELSLFRRFPKLRFAAVGVLFVPAIYAFLYLSSVWDPAGHAPELPVAIVNSDTGISYQGHDANVGEELVKALEAKKTFEFHRLDDAEAAKKAVREGKFSFALIVPPDFSAQAVPGRTAGGGKLTIYTSEGNNYAGASVARRFAPEVAHQVNETLNEKRWALVLATSAGAGKDLSRMKDAVGQLKAGAHQLDEGMGKAEDGAVLLAAGLEKAHAGSVRLSDGAVKVADGTAKVTEGMKALGGGIRTIDSKLPAEKDLTALRDGAHQLSAGEQQLSSGLQQLDDGSSKLLAGAGKLRTETAKVPIVGGKISAGAGQLEDGARKLNDGLASANEGGKKLAAGSEKLDDGVARLTHGMTQLSGGVHLMASKLPEDSQLDALKDGSLSVSSHLGELTDGLARLDDGSQKLSTGMSKLKDGSARLAGGLDLLDSAIPASLPTLEGDARGLAASVEPVIEAAAPVPNNGTGFAPYFVPLALWVGAVMTSFILQFRHLPEQFKGTPRLSQVAGKLAIPAALVLGQVAVMTITVRFVLGIAIPHPVQFLLTLMTASLTFVTIVLALVRILGDVGKVTAVVLLILQLSAAGGVAPIELTGPAFRIIHPFLPFSWVVRALRATLFGAFDGNWAFAYGHVVFAGGIAALVVMLAGKWKFVEAQRYAPAIDV